MKTQDIRSMGLAYLEVLEGKDAVNKHGHDHVGKEDNDVNNDKKVDSTDKYLLNRRKAISANIRKEEVEEVDEALVGNQHKLDANKNGKVDAHDFKLLKKKAKTEEKEESPAHEKAEKKKNEATEWPIFARIQEKLTLPSYKVSGIGDDPHEVRVKFATDPHTKGATPPEKIDSAASNGEKDFIAKHGGLGGNDSGINAHEYAAKNTVAHTTNVKVAPGRHNDQKIGDKVPPKSKS